VRISETSRTFSFTERLLPGTPEVGTKLSLKNLPDTGDVVTLAESAIRPLVSMSINFSLCN
jgi:hypothetical protein